MRLLPVALLLIAGACSASDSATDVQTDVRTDVRTDARPGDERAAPGGPDLPDTILLRMALVVGDVDASRRFYHEGLGFEIGFDGPVERPIVNEMLQLDPEQRVYFVVLRGSDDVKGVELDGAMIGLLHVDNPPLPKMHRPGPGTLATGEGMMALLTSDIAGVYERLQAMGATVLYPPTLSPDGSESELVVYDPDGIRLHIVERHRPRE